MSSGAGATHPDAADRDATDPDAVVRVGWIGLGNIGAPMARRLGTWPGGLTVFDVVEAATTPFATAGAAVAGSPAELAAACDVICVMVQTDAQVRDVVTGRHGVLEGARPGAVVAIHSTVEADTPAELAAVAARTGVRVVDAPVSGGAMGAHEGTLAVMVGGDDDAVARLREPFSFFAGLVAHVGPVGAGTRAKLARNLITFASYAAVGEAMRLAEAAGVDLALLGEVVRHSDVVTGGPGAVLIRPTAAPLADGDGLRPIFEHTRQLGEKDLSIALGLAAELGVDLPFAALARTHLGAALGVPHPTDAPEETAP